MDIIQFRKVSHRYAGGQDVLTDITLDVKQGEMVFVTGSSGAGKSTLLKLIAGLERVVRGQLTVYGQNIASLRPRQIPAHRQQLGMVFQSFQLLYDRSVFENVALPLVIRGDNESDIGRSVRAALDQVGLLGKERIAPIRLSGGEQQRVGIARAIVTRPRLLLADEPTGNLDPVMAWDVMKLFDRFRQVGTTVMVATHAIDLVHAMGHRIIHLEKGQMSSQVPTPASHLGEAP